ncbi:anaerobic ribonucleoside-triphosphate reductase activating protein [Corynebacterium sp. LK2510]|uniref:anaerobic ribonucleoside-triphosphate reductase activating protein n=1 Tax=Corynebacterium sp. LK2510 TaxID=3110472 RepID=UPI0034CDDE7D
MHPLHPAPYSDAGTEPQALRLPLAGIMPFSVTDWPDMITVTAFTQGCPLRCTYCHNPGLQGYTPGEHTFAEALALMDERATLVDALVISGGEPLVHTGLGAAIALAHAHGHKVGLHTCGYSPARLGRLLGNAETRPDWIGFDIKALPSHLPAVTGASATMARGMWTSLDMVTAAARDYGMGLQVRTTVWPGGVVERDLPALEAAARERGAELVVQWARGCDAAGNYIGPA